MAAVGLLSLGEDRTVLMPLILITTDEQTHAKQEAACSVMRAVAKTLSWRPRARNSLETWISSHPGVTLYSWNNCHGDIPQQRVTLARAYDMPQEPGKNDSLKHP